jgi:hypothetical protein
MRRIILFKECTPRNQCSQKKLAALKLLNQFIEEAGVVAASLKSVPYTNSWY